MAKNTQKLLYLLYHWAWMSLDLVYPPQCGGCGKEREKWCDKCNRSIKKIPPPWCKYCGQHIDNGDICRYCHNRELPYNGLRSLAIYEGSLRNAILRLKYKQDISLGDVFTNLLIDLFSSQEWAVELIMPVPLGLDRQAERGYNQASLLARPVALACGILYKPGGLIKIKNTPSQVGLNYEQRYKNVKDVFQANENYVKGKRIMIIDDVCTSGATIEACAGALKKAHAKEIYALTLARASVDFS